MARHYSPKSFLRQAPNPLLQRYLSGIGVGKDIPWKHLDKRSIDLVLRAIERAPERLRRVIDRDFREIFAMADEAGVKTLIDEGRDRHHNIDLTGEFDKMGGHLEKAFWTFLEHPRVFHVAQRFHYADRLGRWRRWADLPEAGAATDEESCRRLEAAISGYYSRAEGRGHRCQVDHYRRDQRLYWFAFPEDYAESRLVWDEEETLKAETQRPAFEVIFVYDTADWWLDLHVGGSSETARELRIIFGRAILGVDLSDLDDEGVTYDLNGLLKRDFRFTLQPEDGVEQVQVRWLRVRIMGEGNRRITLEANPSKDPEGVRELLEVVLAAEGIPRDLVVVDRVGLQLLLRDAPSGRRRLAFQVSHPNSCTLKHDPEDDTARELLKRWGFDVSGRSEGTARKRRRKVQYVLRH